MITRLIGFRKESRKCLPITRIRINFETLYIQKFRFKMRMFLDIKFFCPKKDSELLISRIFTRKRFFTNNTCQMILFANRFCVHFFRISKSKKNAHVSKRLSLIYRKHLNNCFLYNCMLIVFECNWNAIWLIWIMHLVFCSSNSMIYCWKSCGRSFRIIEKSNDYIINCGWFLYNYYLIFVGFYTVWEWNVINLSQILKTNK